jgi:hypothetical protein
MTSQHKYIRCVFTVGSHLTNYYDNKTVVVKKYIRIKIKKTDNASTCITLILRCVLATIVAEEKQ